MHFRDVPQNSIFLFNPYSRANRYYQRMEALAVGWSIPIIHFQMPEYGLMSIQRQFVAAVALVMGLSASAWGQAPVPSAKFSPQNVEYPGNTRPLAEPGIFDYDGQMFAPVEFNNSEEKSPNTGFFFTMDRIYNSITRGGSRPSGQLAPVNATPTGSDWQWGNRFNTGWMTDADSGWEGVFEYSSGSFFAAGSDILVGNPMMVTTRYSNFELNRVFRQNLSQGGYFEPYVGMRYIGLIDNTIEDINITVAGTGSGNRFKQNVTNDMFGGHVGGRYNVNRGRYRYAFDGSMATMYNRQGYNAIDLLFQGTTVSTNEFFDNDTSFVPVLDTRFELAYAITRDIGLRGGVQLQYMWDGVVRSDNRTTAVNPNSAFGVGGGQTGVFDESSLVAGFSMGFEWRR